MDRVLLLTFFGGLVQVTSSSPHDVIAVAVGSQVYVRNVSDVTRVPCDPATSYVPTGVTYHPGQGTIYWVGRQQSWVGVAPVQLGKAHPQRKIYSDIMSDAQDVDLDPTSGLLYVAAHEGIMVMDLQGVESVLLVKDLGQARSVAVDHHNRYLYWTDTQYRTVERAHLDGRSRKTIFYDQNSSPGVITVDFHESRLLWIEETRNEIFTSTLEGTDIRRVTEATSDVIMHLTVDQHFIYYAINWAILRIDKHRALAGLPFQPEVVAKANCMELRSLVVISSTITFQKSETPCDGNDHGCHRLCIPTSDGYTCASKREFLHVPNKLEAPTRQPETGAEDRTPKSIYSAEYQETRMLRTILPVIVVIVVVLTVVLIVIVVTYWVKTRNEQHKVLTWDIHSVTDFKPHDHDFSLYWENDVVDDISLNSESLEA